MNFILNAPATIKVITSLIVILVLNRFINKLMLSVIIGTLLLAFWSGHTPLAVLTIAWNKFSAAGNLFFMAAITLTIGLSHQMSATGVMKDLVSLIRKRISKRSSLVVLPALIGLLPMPGGALFSAPLVDDCDPEKKLDPLLKTRINYWFRHIWEYWWPLYPGVLLAMEITGLPVWQFMLVQLPMSLCAVLSGYFFLLRKITNHQPAARESILKEFLLLVLPILLIILCYFVFTFLVPAVSGFSQYLPISLGILLAMFVLQIQRPLALAAWKKNLLSAKILFLILLVAAVRIYGAFIETPLPDGSLLADHMKSELAAAGLPLVITLITIPFICGLASGIAIGFVGASFPIVMSFISPDALLGEILSTVVLAYGFGYIGMILSPVHICLVVTNDYFHTKTSSSIRLLIPPALGVIAGTLLVSSVLRLLPF